MTKREAARRDKQRRASHAAGHPDLITRKQAPPAATPAQPTPPGKAKALLTYDDLVAFGVPWSRSHLYRVMTAGRFPRPVTTGPEPCDRKLWRQQDVERWAANLAYTNAEDGEAA